MIAIRYYFSYPYTADTKDYYQWARCINLGMLPYKDFNMLQTPLSAYISALFYKLDNTIFFLHIVPYTIVNFITVFFSIKIIKLKKEDAPIFPIYLWGVTSAVICNALYNTLSAMFWVIGVYIHLSYKRKNKLYKLALIGFLAGMCFYAKQNTAAYMVAGFGIVFILNWIKKKEKARTIVKEISVLWLSFLATIGAGLLIFWYQGNLNEFFEYAVFPASNFIFPYLKSAADVMTIFLMLFIPLSIIIIAGISAKETEISVMGIISILIAFPVANIAHLSLSFLFLFIIFSISFDTRKKTKFFLMWIVSMVYVDMILSMTFYSSIKEIPKVYDKKIIEYLDNKDVSKYHIVDAIAGYYSVYYDKYDKYYDLFLSGNLGKKTQTDVIQETIDNEQGNFFVVRTSKYKSEDEFTLDVFSLNSKNLYEYIQDRCEYVENIDENYVVYKIP